MTDTYSDLVEQGKTLYGNSVNQCLAGFQLIEEQLKSYIEAHFDFTRTYLAGRLHFDFKRDDYQDAALGRLTQVFSKICANSQLVTDLRGITKRRDHVAHRALLVLYGPDKTPQEYSNLMNELGNDSKLIIGILGRIVEEIRKLGN